MPLLALSKNECNFPWVRRTSITALEGTSKDQSRVRSLLILFSAWGVVLGDADISEKFEKVRTSLNGIYVETHLESFSRLTQLCFCSHSFLSSSSPNSPLAFLTRPRRYPQRNKNRFTGSGWVGGGHKQTSSATIREGDAPCKRVWYWLLALDLTQLLFVLILGEIFVGLTIAPWVRAYAYGLDRLFFHPHT